MIEENALPGGWVQTTIENLTSLIQYGYTESAKDEPVGPKFLRITDIQDGYVDWNSVPFCLCPEDEHLKYLLEPGDIVFARTGATTGKSYLITDCPDAIFASYLIRLRFSKSIDSHYVSMFLDSPSYWAQIMTVRQGSAQPGVNAKLLAAIQIPVSPLSEQHRIVAAIEQQFTRLDAAVTALKHTKAKLKRYRASVLKAAVEGKLTEAWRAEHPAAESASVLLERILVERRAKWEADLRAKGKDPARVKYVEPAMPDLEGLSELPEGWCWARVEQISQIQGGIQKQPSRAPKENAFPYLRVANVLRGRLDLSVIERMEVFRDELNTLRLEAGDMLIVEGNGSRTEIGRSALWKGEIKDCIHQNHIIRVRLDTVLPKYLDFYWNSPTGNKRVMDVAASTSGLYTLSVGKISRLPAPLPPLAEQQEIISEVERRLSIVTQLEATVEADLKRAERLRQSILKEAFAGRLVPQDPDDEPASVLLERIHQEREGQKQGPIKKPRAMKTISAPRMPDVEPMEIDASEMEQMDLWASIGSRE